MALDYTLIKTPFANAGDRAVTPVPAQLDGSVSYTDGYGPDYQLDPATDPSAKDIDRLQMNGLWYDTTIFLAYLQGGQIPEFVSTADNGGSPFSYTINALVRYTDGFIYISLVAANTTTPADATKWRRMFATSNISTIGGTHTYVIGENMGVVNRSNAGSPMVDTFPGTGTAVMPAGWSITMKNSDVAGLIAYTSAAGATIDGTAAGTYRYLGPGQSLEIYSDGSNYFTKYKILRCRLGANISLFVSSAGSNSDAGVNVGVPFATVQFAIDTLHNRFDLNGFVATVTVADATYNGAIAIQGPMTGALTSASLIISGNTGTPANVILNNSGGNTVVASGGAQVTVRGAKITSSAIGLAASGTGSSIFFDLLNFGACGTGISAVLGGNVFSTGAFTLSGNMASWAQAASCGVIIIASATITVTGTPAWSTAGAISDGLGFISVSAGAVFSGSATGKTFIASLNGVINGNGVTFPGNIAGTTATGGQAV